MKHLHFSTLLSLLLFIVYNITFTAIKLPSLIRWHLFPFLPNPGGHEVTQVEFAKAADLSLKYLGLHLRQLILSGHLSQFKTDWHSFNPEEKQKKIQLYLTW